MGSTALLLIAAMAVPIGTIDPPRAFHTALDHTSPADGDTLAAAPDQVELVFTGPIEDGETSVTLVLPDGGSRELETTTVGSETPTVSASLPSLARGGYRIDWRVLSPDGHPLEDSFVFYVEGDSDAATGGDRGTGPATSEAPETDDAGGNGVMDGPGDEGADTSAIPTRAGTDGKGFSDSGLEPAPASDQGEASDGTDAVGLVLASVGFNLALLGLAGLLGFAAWGPAPPRAPTLQAALGLALAASLLAPAQAWLWTTQALGGDPGIGARIEGLVGLTSGRSIGLRLGLVWLALWVLAVSRRTRMAAILVGLAVAAGALGGHPAATSPTLAQPASLVHLLAVSTWVGGLLYIVTQRSSAKHAHVIHRVSTVALISVIFVALTGVAQGWLFLGSTSDLLGTEYGRLVLAKAAGLLILVGFGAVHRLWLIPDMEEDGETGPLTRAVKVEMAVAGTVVVVASVLAHVTPASS